MFIHSINVDKQTVLFIQQRRRQRISVICKMTLTQNDKNSNINTIGKVPVLTGKTTHTHKTHIWTSVRMNVMCMYILG